MAKLESKDGSQEVPDGGDMIEAAEKLGVPMSCYVGWCASCQVEVLEGEENLEEKTQCEKDMNLEPKIRLACQCKIKKGNVKIRF